ncbi:MAG: hypothetical protein D6718_11900 [Acidobacteria bacterium]|nr:MAG: hypothetical protein D6718_11900 [Acidobacteriota bacterium]
MPLGSIAFGQGLVSGLDFRSIIDALLEAERAPIKTLQKRIDTFNRAKSSAEELSGLLETFKSKLEELSSDTGVGGKTASLDDETALTASARPGALAGTYQIEVTRIAQAHRVRSDGFADRYSPLVSDGTITIQSGSNDTITIDVSAANGNNSLRAIADEINNADAGVIASIVNDGSSDILIVRAEETGTENALTITDTTNLNLDDAGNELQPAQDAELIIDGITVTSSSNTVTGAIQGVTLELTAETTSPVTLTVADDVEGAKQALRDFVEAYNEVNDYFDKNFGSAELESASAVAGDALIRGIQRQLQQLLTGSVTGIPDGKLDSLSELGILVADGTGRLEFKESTFDDIVEQGRFDEVRAVIQSTGTATDGSVVFLSAGSNAVPGTYAVHITQAAEKAEVRGGTAIRSQGISKNETLTITLNGTSTDVALAKNDTISVIVDKINAALDAAGIEATALDDNGVLVIQANDYGSQYDLTVVSDRQAKGDGKSTEIGTTPQNSVGVDVAGTIGGETGVGTGQVLVGPDGTDVDGIRIRVYATADSVAAKGGDFGTVGYSLGVADRFINAIDDITDPFEGTIHALTEGLQDSIDTIQERIDAINARLVRREELLVRQFSAAEQAIAQLQQMQASLQQRA